MGVTRRETGVEDFFPNGTLREHFFLASFQKRSTCPKYSSSAADADVTAVGECGGVATKSMPWRRLGNPGRAEVRVLYPVVSRQLKSVFPHESRVTAN